METAEALIDVSLASSAIVGLTALIRKFIPSVAHEYVLPIISILLGIAVYTFPSIQTGDVVTVEMIMNGIILGGSVTGIYSVVNKKEWEDIRD